MSEQFRITSDGDHITVTCLICSETTATPFGPQARAWTLDHRCWEAT